MTGQNAFIIEYFENVLYMPFIKCLMTNVTKNVINKL